MRKEVVISALELLSLLLFEQGMESKPELKQLVNEKSVFEQADELDPVWDSKQKQKKSPLSSPLSERKKGKKRRKKEEKLSRLERIQILDWKRIDTLQGVFSVEVALMIDYKEENIQYLQ